MTIHPAFWLFLCLILTPLNSWAQSLDYPSFREQTLRNAPLLKQADLYLDQSKAALLRARGGFDPKAFAEHNGKSFNGKTYFQYTETGIKLPTWAGLEFKGAYNLASGSFLNSESKLPADGQASFGLVWSLGQGLLFDERRANLQIAQIGLDLGRAERMAIRNDLMMDAAKAYWSWCFAENALRIVTEALNQAEIRHEGLRLSFFQGERAAVDTLETFIQVQNRQVEVQFAQADARNATLALALYMWNEAQQPVLPETIPPAPGLLTEGVGDMADANAEKWVQTALAQHPELWLYSVKLRQLAIERKLKKEKTKPVVDLSYQLLGDGWQFFPTATANGPAVLANDVKWGLDISYPLLNRKAKGDWQISQIKIAQTELELAQKRQSIQTKVQQYLNEYRNLYAQALLFRDMSVNYRLLLDSETEKFNQGESSVFLLNTREQRWLDAQLKYLKLLTELRKSEAGLRWAAGTLGE